MGGEKSLGYCEGRHSRTWESMLCNFHSGFQSRSFGRGVEVQMGGGAEKTGGKEVVVYKYYVWTSCTILCRAKVIVHCVTIS